MLINTGNPNKKEKHYMDKIEEQIMIENKASIITSYFLAAIERIGDKLDMSTLKDRVCNMELDEFAAIYYSLLEEEQAAFDDERDWTDLEEMSRYLIFTKTVNRYWDAKAEATWLDDCGILHITPKSCTLELDIALDTFNELTNNGAYSIGDMQKLVESNSLTSDALTDISTALLLLADDKSITMEG